MQGDLHGAVTDTAWFVDEGLLTVELEKKAARFWPCAIKGHAEVDVRALIAQEKKEKEPVYKPQRGAFAAPLLALDPSAVAMRPHSIAPLLTAQTTRLPCV